MKRFWLLPLALLLAAPVAAEPDNSRWNLNGDGVVLNGYDAVAYFQQDKAVPGKAEYAAQYDGARFHFSTPENQAAFEADPARYAPQFGGFCAFGVAAKQAKAPTDPATFKIYHGQLLVFFNDLYEGQRVNTKVLWNQNEAELYRAATTTWPTLD